MIKNNIHICITYTSCTIFSWEMSQSWLNFILALAWNIIFYSFKVLIYKYFKNLSRCSPSFTTRLIGKILCGLKAKYLITVSCSGDMEEINSLSFFNIFLVFVVFLTLVSHSSNLFFFLVAQGLEIGHL